MEEVKDLNAFADEAFLKRMSELPIKFGVKSNQTFNEAYIGAGYIVTVTDYGSYQTLHIIDFVAKIRKQIATGGSQYSHFFHIDGSMTPVEATSLLVILNPQGYSIRAEYPYATKDNKK